MTTAQMKKGRVHRKDATPTATAKYSLSASESWLPRLQELAARHSDLGIEADLTALSLVDLWGIYCFLQHLEEGAA